MTEEKVIQPQPTLIKKANAKKIVLISLVVGCLGLPTLIITGFLFYKFLTTFVFKLKIKNCQAITPLFLSELEAATMIKPIYGEKCELTKDNFLLRLAYKDETDAKNAAFGLRIASPGEIRTESYIMDGTDAAAFYSFENKVYLVVIPKIGTAKKAESFLKKINPKIALADFIVPTATSFDIENAKDEFLEKIIEEASKPTSTPTLKPTVTTTPKTEKSTSVKIPTKAPESPTDETTAILSAARAYVQKYTAPDLKYTLSLRKIVGNYALVDVIPQAGTAEEAGVILEKISGIWVAQEMGTFFPEWEEKVPELFR